MNVFAILNGKTNVPKSCQRKLPGEHPQLLTGEHVFVFARVQNSKHLSSDANSLRAASRAGEKNNKSNKPTIVD